MERGIFLYKKRELRMTSILLRMAEDDGDDTRRKSIEGREEFFLCRKRES